MIVKGETGSEDILTARAILSVPCQITIKQAQGHGDLSHFFRFRKSPKGLPD
jgi:hypothetical protein